jgi:hypothetical protein
MNLASMEKKKSAVEQPMKLASMVLMKEITLDQGLIFAQNAGVLDTFIEGMNVLAQGRYFEPTFARERLRSGNAARAVEGRIPCLMLPLELKDWNIEKLGQALARTSGEPHPPTPPSDRPEASEEETSTTQQTERERYEHALSILSGLDRKMRDLRSRRRECNELLNLLLAFEKNRRTAPKAWVGGLIIVGLTLLLAGPVWLFLDSRVGVGAFLLGGIFVAGLVVRREMIWSEHVQDSEQAIGEQRKVNMEIQRNAISELDRNLQTHRVEASDLVDTFCDSDRKSLVNSYPDIFVKPHSHPEV